MKKLLTILSLLIIISCSKEIELDQIVERGGLSYEVNNEKPFTGTTLSYHPNGQLESRIKYKNGLKDGLSESFHENGQLESRIKYKNGSHVDGQVEIFYKNGTLESKTNYKDGQLDGLSEFFYEDGTLRRKYCYRMSKLNPIHCHKNEKI